MVPGVLVRNTADPLISHSNKDKGLNYSNTIFLGRFLRVWRSSFKSMYSDP